MPEPSEALALPVRQFKRRNGHDTKHVLQEAFVGPVLEHYCSHCGKKGYHIVAASRAPDGRADGNLYAVKCPLASEAWWLARMKEGRDLLDGPYDHLGQP